MEDMDINKEIFLLIIDKNLRPRFDSVRLKDILAQFRHQLIEKGILRCHWERAFSRFLFL